MSKVSIEEIHFDEATFCFHGHGGTVAQLVARRTNNREIVGSIPANAVCIHS